MKQQQMGAGNWQVNNRASQINKTEMLWRRYLHASVESVYYLLFISRNTAKKNLCKIFIDDSGTESSHDLVDSM